MRAANSLGRDFAKANRAHLPAEQVGQRADALLHRHPLVPSVQVIEVDDIGVQPRQAFIAVLLDGDRPAVNLALSLALRNMPPLVARTNS